MRWATLGFIASESTVQAMNLIGRHVAVKVHRVISSILIRGEIQLFSSLWRDGRFPTTVSVCSRSWIEVSKVFCFFFLPFFYYFSFSPRFRLFIFIFLNVTQRALIQVACSCLKTCNDLSSYSRNKGREKRKRQSLSVGRGTDGAINKPTLFKRGIMNFNLCLFSFLFSSFILVYLRVLRCE